MPELPEIASRAREVKRALTGKTIERIEVLQPKCLNVPVRKFKSALVGATLGETTYHGKWLFTETSRGHILINLGMGGDLRLVKDGRLPEKWRVAFHFTDGTALTANFWWFGHVHYAAPGRLDEHRMTAELGPNAIDLSRDEFRKLVAGRRGSIKSFLLNQKRIAGIGNAYIHDILFLAGLHPLRKIDTLTGDEIDGLWQAIRDGLLPSLRKGGAWYERGLSGRRGRFVYDDILVGYREGKPCPNCGGKIRKVKTGSTSTFVCPKCQPLRAPKKRGAKLRTTARTKDTGRRKKAPRRRAAAKTRKEAGPRTKAATGPKKRTSTKRKGG